ncbi:growth hormone-regulated TBC protein 1-A isoform X2 [Phlebotomus papatasi]|uniref:growth hormone-regulated TBC protein 1-A isoform X2 n=1 Tax=Phlebotomus papatasi TaxID=29031 RepID=UPI0024836358|nr:growth hormone-regulated TBC protein 1-A isoform X2 [Phlebotomus papatasi]
MGSKFSDVDEYGFQRPEDFDYSNYEEIMSEYLKVLAKRQMQWEKYMRSHGISVMNRALKRYIRKGVPAHLRKLVWLRTSGATAAMASDPALYRNLLFQKHDEEIVDMIKIDLPRTFPNNIFFPDIQNQLFNILVAYAHLNKDVGYCQGLNYIAGLLLIVTKDEEGTFWLLRHIVERIAPNYHTKSMSGLITDIAVLNELLKVRVPDVHAHINNLGLPWAVIVTKWFICLFAEVLPTETVLRIWDCLFSEGYKILFRVSITLILRHRDTLMATEDISQLANVFREMLQSPMVTNCHEFMNSIFTIPGNIRRRDIESLRTQVQ